MSVQITGPVLAGFVSGEGFAPGANVRLTADGDGVAIAPVDQRPEACERPPGLRDRQGQETLCGVLLSREGATLRLAVPDGEMTVQLLREAHIHVLADSGITLEEVREGDAAVGHGVQVTGHKRGDAFLVGLVIIGPEMDGPPPPR